MNSAMQNGAEMSRDFHVKVPRAGNSKGQSKTSYLFPDFHLYLRTVSSETCECRGTNGLLKWATR